MFCKTLSHIAKHTCMVKSTLGMVLLIIFHHVSKDKLTVQLTQIKLAVN